MPEPVKKNHRYISGLDGLRALSVIAVIMYHLHLKGVDGGYLGVTIFFVLSGYLITDLLVNEWEKTGKINLKHFWLRRIRRLIPALFVMLILVGFWVTLFQRTFLADLRSEILATVLYVSNWFYVVQNHSYFAKFSSPSPLQHMWSLAVEEQFYIVWPILMTLGLKYVRRKEKLAFAILGLGIVSAIAMAVTFTPGEDPSRVYYGTDTRAFSLLIGAAAALLWPSHKLTKTVSAQEKKWLDLIGSTSLLLLVLMMIFMNEEGPFLYYGGMFLGSIVAVLLIAVIVHPTSKMGQWLSFKPLVWIGVRSYGIYIWHFPIVVLMGAGMDASGLSWGKMILILALTFFFAELSWRWIEDPIRKGALHIWLDKFRTKEWSWRWQEWSLSYRIGSALACCIIIIFVMGMIFAPEKKQTSSEVLKQHLVQEQQKLEKAQAKPTATSVKKDTAVEKEKATILKKEKKVKVNEKPQKIVAKEVPSNISVTAIGDSIMLSAASALKTQIPQIVVDANIGRQVYDAPDIVETLKRKGQLGQVVVIGLGSNGNFKEAQLKELLDSIGSNRHIYMINTRVPRSWQDSVNKKIKEAARKYKNVTVIDWQGATKGYDGIFYEDQIHPNNEGGDYYSALVSNVIAENE